MNQLNLSALSTEEKLHELIAALHEAYHVGEQRRLRENRQRLQEKRGSRKQY